MTSPPRSFALRETDALAVWVAVVAGAFALAELSRAFVDVRRYRTLTGGVSPLDDALGSPAAGRLTRVTIALFAAWAAVFLVWLLRSRDNAEALGAVGFGYSRVWVIAGWFVPGVNLWLPLKILANVWRASDPDLPHHGQLAGVRVATVVLVWWATFVAAALALAGSLYLAGGTNRPLQLSLTITSELAFVVASALVGVVAVRLAGRQRARLRRLLGRPG